MEDLLTLQYHLTQDIVEPAFEMSKRGGHLWIFLATPLLARECDNTHRCREELATVGWSRLTDWHGEGSLGLFVDAAAAKQIRHDIRRGIAGVIQAG
jgi:hypothetical protein